MSPDGNGQTHFRKTSPFRQSRSLLLKRLPPTTNRFSLYHFIRDGQSQEMTVQQLVETFAPGAGLFPLIIERRQRPGQLFTIAQLETSLAGQESRQFRPAK
jgi:hypothetical protein